MSQHNQNKACWRKIKHIYYSTNQNNDKDPKFKIDDMLEYQNIKK